MTSDRVELVTTHIDGPVALVTLNRPNRLNALSQVMMQAIVDTFAGLRDDSSVRAVVLTGAGKAFCAGLDLKELGQTSAASFGHGQLTLGTNSHVIQAITGFGKPVIGAVNGPATTGGFELALACDFLVAGKSGRFADTHALVGVVPGWGLSQKLPRLIGVNRAKELSFTGRFVDAREAWQLGLVNHVYEDSQLLSEAMRIAGRIAQTRQDTLTEIKQLMDEGWNLSLGDALLLEEKVSNRYNRALDLSDMTDRLADLKRRANPANAADEGNDTEAKKQQ